GAVEERIAPEDGRRRTLHRVDRAVLVADHHPVGGAIQRRWLEPDLPEYRARAEEPEMDAGVARLLDAVVHRLRPVRVITDGQECFALAQPPAVLMRVHVGR